MSSSNGGVGQREVAYRLFAAEYEDADFSYSESDEDRAPNYVITPMGARVNRLFVVGVLTEVEAVSDDVLRGRVVDPTGAFVLYAGQYQPDEQAFLEAAETPTFVAVTGKARTFQPEDSQQVFTSVRPESINEVDAETRDRWTVQAAEQTIARVGRMARALSTGLDGDQLRAALAEDGIHDDLADGIALALDHYGTTPTYLDAVREVALDAARVVAGQKNEVRKLDVAPDAAGDETVADLLSTLADLDISPAETHESATGPSDEGQTPSEQSVSGVSETASDASTEQFETANESPETAASETSEASAREASSSATAETPSPEETEPSSGSAGEEHGDLDADVEGDDFDADEIGNFDADEIGDFDADEFELEAETRKEIEEEYGTEFQSGAEVDDPGTAGIETPTETEPPSAGEQEATDSPEERATADSPETPATADSPERPAETESPAEETVAAEPEGETAGGDESADQSTDERPEDIQETVVEVMRELDDGTGADREELVAEMGQRYSLDTDEVEEAIQAALMDGQCYEPDDTSLKPI